MDGLNLDLAKEQKLPAYQALFLLLALLFATYLRLSLLIIYPFVVVFLFKIFKWKIDRNAVYLLAFVFFCWLLSFRHGLDLKYNLISFYYFIPFFLLLFAVPSRVARERGHLKMLMAALSIVAAANNMAGIVQYVIFPNDDSFTGLYGRYTVSQNGLSLINAVLFFYHFCVYRSEKKSISLLLAIFFIICSVLGFYGAGLMVFIGALILTFFRVRLYNILQLIFFTAVSLCVLVLLMKLISPATLEYNVNIINIFLHPSEMNFPRKLIIFQNYYHGYGAHPIDLLFGSGPGTFNSRTAFMVGSPSYFDLSFIKSGHQPFYFRQYAYPLWNPSNTGPFDGFMNQPFSSLLSILGEYGLLFTAGVVYVLFFRFRYFASIGNRLAKERGASVELKMYKFCSILTLLLIVIDNYMEYPEIIALLLIIVKLSQQQLRKAFDV